MKGSALWTAAVLAVGTMARIQAGTEPSPPLPQPGQAVKGLTLALSATPARTSIDRDGTAVKPVSLTFRFSASEVTRLNTYDLVWSRLTLHVTGPDETSVDTQPLLIDRQMRAPVHADFPYIGPAKAWTHTHPTFPGEFGGLLISLRRAGTFRIRAVYSNPADALGDNQLAAGCWTGTVVSDEITLAVGDDAGGPPQDGLQLGLTLPKDAYAVGEPVKAEVRLANVGEKPILIVPAFYMPDTIDFDVIDPDGSKVGYTGPLADWDIPDYDKAVVELKPGASITKTVGLYGYRMTRAGKYRLAAYYTWRNAAPPPGRRPTVWKRPAIWTGTVTSNEVTITVVPGGPQTDQPIESTVPRKPGQGVRGRVVRTTVHFDIRTGLSTATDVPLAVPVYIFRATVKPHPTPNPRHPSLAAIVTAGANGAYAQALEPGTYTVAAVVGGKLQEPPGGERGSWPTVAVRAGQWATCDLRVPAKLTW